jgi:hypothetical protein
MTPPSGRWSRRLLLGPLVLPALVGLLACGTTETAPADAGVPDGDGRPILPPDLTVGDAQWIGNVGHPCDPNQDGKGCTGDAVCLDVMGKKAGVTCDLTTGAGCGGVCTLVGCTMEDITTSQIEDDCPSGTVCTRVPVASGDKNFCLQSCEPAVDENPCEKLGHAGLTCHPATIVLNDHTEVCLYPACSKDTDCGNQDPINPDSTCLLPSGICLAKGSKNGVVGGPCKESKDCGPYQYCLLEQKDAGGELFLEGGYCTLIGCKYFNPDKPDDTVYWKCPAESKCFAMGSGQFVSFCLAVSCEPEQPTASDGCRDEASDGQYDCIMLGTEKVCWVDIKSKSN